MKNRIGILTLVVLAFFGVSLLAPVGFAAVGVKSAGSQLCTATDINFSTNTTATCDGSTATIVGSGTQTITGGTINGTTIGATTSAPGTFQTQVAVNQYASSASATVTTYQRIMYQYFLLYAYQASNRPASGAPAGAMIAIRNNNNIGDCGVAGGGTSYTVCSSDGTNWKPLRSTSLA